MLDVKAPNRLVRIRLRPAMPKVILFIAVLLLCQTAVPQCCVYNWKGADSAVSEDGTKRFVSPDGALTAIVFPTGKEKGAEEYESRVEIHRKGGTLLGAHDFSSSDGEHGYGVDVARWTPDLQFFVFRMRNSGGHSPMFAPVVFWSRRANHFYQLNDYTADEIFSVTSPDEVSVSTWPEMKPVTISLKELGQSDVTTLQSSIFPK